VVQSKMGIMFDHYDQVNGWEHTKPGWYECAVHAKHINKYLEIIDWVYANVGKCERHCRWYVSDTSTVNFKFRYERDYIMFTLRWS
jgi:hypothetical protein